MSYKNRNLMGGVINKHCMCAMCGIKIEISLDEISPQTQNYKNNIFLS